MIKIILLFITLFFSFNLRVDAALCDKEHIATLKELAEQVEVSYEYLDYSEEILSGEDGEYSVNSYNVNVNLINDKFYLYYNEKKYYFDDSNDGVIKLNINSGNVEMFIHSSECFDSKLRSISLYLNKFNVYTYKNECRGLEEEIDICNPWYQGELNDELFYNLINKHLNATDEVNDSVWDSFVLFINNNILYIIGGIVLLVIVVFLIFNYRKRSVLE